MDGEDVLPLGHVPEACTVVAIEVEAAFLGLIQEALAERGDLQERLDKYEI